MLLLLLSLFWVSIIYSVVVILDGVWAGERNERISEVTDVVAAVVHALPSISRFVVN